MGDDHPDVAVILEMMGNAEAQLSKMDLARGYFERALSIMVEKFGEGSAMVGVVFANSGAAEQRGGDAARAALQYQKALEILRTSGRPDDLAPVRDRALCAGSEGQSPTTARKPAPCWPRSRASAENAGKRAS